MDTRKSAVDLTVAERDSLLEALIRLKNRPAPTAPAGFDFSVYDQFVLLHGAVMAVTSPAGDGPVNMAHWNIGFCPWHRQYLKAFEKALQGEVAGVTLPYWDWADHASARAELFTGGFLGELKPLSPTPPEPLNESVLRNPVPPADRPAWWPTDAVGFPVALEEGLGDSLARRTGTATWPPGAAQIATLEQLDVHVGIHHFWLFWIALEGGAPGVSLSGPLTDLARNTHNSGHNFIGGHMGRAYSPNDPIFWMHHANVDRIWANWQQFQLTRNGGTHVDHYPPADATIPWNGEPLPHGHRPDDLMWPWVGDAAGYDTANLDDFAKTLLPDFSADPAVTVADVLDIQAMEYEYA